MRAVTLHHATTHGTVTSPARHEKPRSVSERGLLSRIGIFTVAGHQGCGPEVAGREFVVSRAAPPAALAIHSLYGRFSSRLEYLGDYVVLIFPGDGRSSQTPNDFRKPSFVEPPPTITAGQVIGRFSRRAKAGA